MADFFTFLSTFVNSFMKPIFALLSDSRIATWLGSSLLTILVGFFIVRWLYNVFISHPDKIGASGFTSVSNRINDRPDSSSYSSAYRGIKK